jgi:hypothetical protein
VNKRRRAFEYHASIFVVVMIFLATLNWMGGGHFWVQWVFLGWGLGLLLHYLAVRDRLD